VCWAARSPGLRRSGARRRLLAELRAGPRGALAVVITDGVPDEDGGDEDEGED
jgi:hypothetical protein